ncbi:histidine kinase N-terminal 7TM domain-containing diguanylate cyclase [Salisediminibacterium beveridgei]|uniref:Response regulator, PleD-like n=1 Tax=Salisediminibacterium beveridgei TaxID=632773 RepID=A0A1D7QR13_9BACI|nr:diguanylate cyclase [Salisediminibacterium beveridgei]AOM81452.1 Response regulator, PleD-like [Salisediminibacterium beveridgei]
MQWIHPYPFYLLLTGVLVMSLLIPLLRPPRTYGRNYLAIILCLGGLLLSLSALELFVSDGWLMLLFRNLQQIPLFFTPIILFALAREYTGYDSEKTKRWLMYLALPSLYFTGLIFFEGWHGFFRESVHIEHVWGLTQIQVTQTMQGFMLSTYPIVIGVISGFIMLQHLLVSSKSHRKQHVLFLLAYVIPLVNIILVPVLPANIPGQMAFGFSLMGIVLYILYYRYQLLSIWPVAKDRIFDAMKEGVLVIDREWRLIEINSAAQEILSSVANTSEDEEFSAERAAYNWIRPDEAFLNAVQKKKTFETEWTVNGEHEGDKIYFEARTFPIARSRSGDEATLIILNDITDKKHHEADLIKQATIDYLTGIPNRRSFIEQYQKLMAAKGETGSLMLIDLDHFKKVNDAFGHQTGDEVLCYFAMLLQEYFVHGLVGRIGGEEFGVFIHENCHEAVRQAEHFQQHLRVKPFHTHDNNVIAVPMSIGVAEVMQETRAIETAYRRADEAMYEAKRGGRNQTVCYKETCG